MADRYNLARCTRTRENLKRLRDERKAQLYEISRLEQRLDVRRGEIAEAENTLARIAEAIRQTSDGAIAMGVDILTGDRPGLVRDGVSTAMQLANAEARQRQKVAHLKRQLESDAFDLQAARDKLNNIELDIQRTINFLQSNDC